MSPRYLARIVPAALVLIMLFSDAALLLPSGGVETAGASFPGSNAIVGFFKTMGALNRRNRIYWEAGATAEEINTYYDSLIGQAQDTRREIIHQAAAGGASSQSVRPYIRIEAALEAERTAAIQMIEAEKNEARRNFNRTLGKEIANVLIASPGGQRILGRVRETIGGAREAAVAVQEAASSGKPIEALGEALAKKVGDIPLVQEAARRLGSAVGHGIDRALGGALGRVEAAMDNVQSEMGKAIDLLDGLDSEVAGYQEQERDPISLLENGDLAGTIIPVNRANPTADVTASAYAGAVKVAGGLDPGTSRADMRGRIRDALLDERIAGIIGAVSGTIIGQSYCTVVDRSAYEAAANQLGIPPETAGEPDKARYWACYDIQTQLATYVKMFGSAAEAAEEAASPEPELVEPSPDEIAPTETVDVDVCTLLPVDASQITNRSEDSCVASIDSLVGCNECGSDISITLTESQERAQQAALEASCGNPNFFAKGDSPIGDSGVTCTETSGEEYREGVAQSYIYLIFSSGPFVISIHSGYPGQEALVLELGQEVIERVGVVLSQ